MLEKMVKGCLSHSIQNKHVIYILPVHQMNPLKGLNPVGHPYTLEVSSPGLDRPLFTPADFRRFLGKLAAVLAVGALGFVNWRRPRLAAVLVELTIAFVVILALMVTVIYNDLMRISWIERLIPWRN